MGRHSLKTAASPPTMMVRVPSRAPVSPPLTGASSILTPFAANEAETLLVTLGEMVLMSISTSPSCAPSATPPLPRTTSFTASESVSIVMTTSTRSAVAFGEGEDDAPAETSSSTPGLLLLQTVRSNPDFSRFRAMGLPIIPSPMKPIRGSFMLRRRASGRYISMPSGASFIGRRC
jgi:hypothetical protein